MTGAPLRIGISACFFHADPQRALFKGKALLYVEQSLSHYVMSTGAAAFMLPTVPKGMRLGALLDHIDALVLHGGADVAPSSYGQTPERPEWAGDPDRDAYESELLRECMRRDKPVLGVCRGAQLINVVQGGTMYQDLASQLPSAKLHRDWEIYDRLFHPIAFVPDTRLAALYPGQTTVRVNSVHHQAINRLGDQLQVEARAEDGVIEAIRLVRNMGAPYVFGVQWHPEYQDPEDTTLLSSRPILDDFLQAAETRR